MAMDQDGSRIYGFVWKCRVPSCTPKNPMVLLIIIPMKNGYFIGGIPHFQTYTYKNITLQKSLGLRLTFLNMKKIEETDSFFFSIQILAFFVSDTIIKRLIRMLVWCHVVSIALHNFTRFHHWQAEPRCHQDSSEAGPSKHKLDIPANTINHQWFLYVFTCFYMFLCKLGHPSRQWGKSLCRRFKSVKHDLTWFNMMCICINRY